MCLNKTQCVCTCTYNIWQEPNLFNKSLLVKGRKHVSSKSTAGVALCMVNVDECAGFFSALTNFCPKKFVPLPQFLVLFWCVFFKFHLCSPKFWEELCACGQHFVVCLCVLEIGRVAGQWQSHALRSWVGAKSTIWAPDSTRKWNTTIGFSGKVLGFSSPLFSL